MSEVTFDHWCAPYIGKAHSKTGDGPDSFSCWGLVRAIVRERHGLNLPMVHLDGGKLEFGAVAALKDAARSGGWMRVIYSGRARPHEGDIVLLQSPIETHVGYVISYQRRLNVIHSKSGAGVVREEWADAIRGALPELWRRYP